MRGKIKYGKYIGVIVIVVIHCQFFRMQMEQAGMSVQLTVGDYIVHFFKGVLPYAGFQSQEPFNIPPLWSLFLIYFFVCIARLESGMFRKNEYQYIMRRGTRKRWWNLQNVSICLETLFYLITAYGTFFVYGICTGADWNGVSKKMQMKWNGLDLSGTSMAEIWRDTIIVSFFVMLAFAYVQYVISLAVNAMVGLLVSVAVLVSSVFYMSPLLLGNYLMLLRGSERMDGGVMTGMGIVMSVSIVVIAYFAGGRIIQKKDLF